MNIVSASSSTSSHRIKQAQEEEYVLADLDDEDASAFGLPPKYSMLKDKHFPLFLTYDQVSIPSSAAAASRTECLISTI